MQLTINSGVVFENQHHIHILCDDLCGARELYLKFCVCCSPAIDSSVIIKNMLVLSAHFSQFLEIIQ